ncbi:MAG: glutathione S-transferase family protein [Alphaproteobacteria bacterium]|nr:glutathione S-transferase family protein [Alphaproteobacteria bacterium]
MYKLYYSPGACSMSIHVALNECGQPVVLEKVDLSAPRPAEFLKHNPRGQVPTLIDGDQTLREGAAILLHILDKHKSPLLPQSGAARDSAIEWMMVANASLHPAYARVFFLKKNGVTEGPLMNAALEGINKIWSEVEQRLSSQSFVCGDQPTIGDILLTVMANWSVPASLGPNTKRMLKAISSRPSYQKAMQAEQVEYKAAA